MTTLWPAVFGNDRPVEVEIGPGRGDVLLAFAAARPDTNFFGIERIAPLAEQIVARARARSLANVAAVGGDARCIVGTLLPSASVQAYHVYFPDPWPKTRHRARRLFHGGWLAAAMARTLVPAGTVQLASDLPDLLADMVAALEAAAFTRGDPSWAPADRPRTKYEIRYGAGGSYAATLIRP